jgi:hypothetical protein
VNENLHEQIILDRYTTDLDLETIGQRFETDVNAFYLDLKQSKPEAQRLIRVGRDLLRLRPWTVANYSLTESGFTQSLANALNHPTQQGIYTDYLRHAEHHRQAENQLHAEYQRHYAAHEINEFLDKLAEFKSPTDQGMNMKAYIKQCLHQGTSFVDSDSSSDRKRTAAPKSSSFQQTEFDLVVRNRLNLPPSAFDVASPSEATGLAKGLKRSKSFRGLSAMTQEPSADQLLARKPAATEQSNRLNLSPLPSEVVIPFESTGFAMGLKRSTSFRGDLSSVTEEPFATPLLARKPAATDQSNRLVLSLPPSEVVIPSGSTGFAMGLERSVSFKEDLSDVTQEPLAGALLARNPAATEQSNAATNQSNNEELDNLVRSMLSLFEAPAPVQPHPLIEGTRPAESTGLTRAARGGEGLSAMAEETSANKPRGNFFTRLFRLD